MQVGQAVDGSLYLSGIILMNLGVHGCSAMRIQVKRKCWLVLEAEDS